MHLGAGKVAAARRKEAEKAAAARAAALQRRQRALKKLGLVPPRGSPYAEEPCLDVARTWFAQVCRSFQSGAVFVHLPICGLPASFLGTCNFSMAA